MKARMKARMASNRRRRPNDARPRLPHPRLPVSRLLVSRIVVHLDLARLDERSREFRPRAKPIDETALPHAGGPREHGDVRARLRRLVAIRAFRSGLGAHAPREFRLELVDAIARGDGDEPRLVSPLFQSRAPIFASGLVGEVALVEHERERHARRLHRHEETRQLFRLERRTFEREDE